MWCWFYDVKETDFRHPLSLSSMRFNYKPSYKPCCYKFDYSHWLKLQHSDWREYFNQWQHLNSQQVTWFITWFIIKSYRRQRPSCYLSFLCDENSTHCQATVSLFTVGICIMHVNLSYNCSSLHIVPWVSLYFHCIPRTMKAYKAHQKVSYLVSVNKETPCTIYMCVCGQTSKQH